MSPGKPLQKDIIPKALLDQGLPRCAAWFRKAAASVKSNYFPLWLSIDGGFY
jgi:hypothetical protein